MRKIKALIVTVIAHLCCIAASAHDFEVNGIYYEIISETDKTVKVTYRLDGNWISNPYYGSVVIPEIVRKNSTEYKVISIDDYTFLSCDGLISVTIGNNVTTIGSHAFEDCTNLMELTIPSSVENIGLNTFLGCTSLRNLTFEDGIKTLNLYYNDYSIYSDLRKGQFADCPLENLYIGRTLKYKEQEEYGYSPFYNIKTLKKVNFGNGADEIGDYLFYDCTELSDLTLGDNISYIGGWSFKNCPVITEITIPEKVTTIGRCAFEGCVGLTEITIPENTFIDNYAFSDCTNLITVINPVYCGIGAFAGCSSLTNVTLSNKNSGIAPYTFRNCSNLKEITIPETVTHIRHYAFAECYKLANIYCNATTPPIIENNNAFSSYNINLYVPLRSGPLYRTAEHWKNFAINIYLVDDIYYNVLSETDVEVTYKNANYNSYTGDITIPEVVEINNEKYNVTSIGTNAFYNCKSLTSIIFGESINYIGKTAFYNCDRLKTVDLVESINYIDDCAFQSCDSLLSIIIPSNVTSINYGVFYGCLHLGSVTLSDNITKIGNYAFDGCTGLTSVICWASMPPEMNLTWKPFSLSTYTQATLFVPSECIEKYKQSNWNNFANIQVIEKDIDNITLDKTVAEMTEGETLTLTATVTPEDATDKTVTWTSSDETVATVKDGVVTALKAGKTTITAKAGEVSATCEITVNAKVIPATSIALDKTTAEMIEGETLTLTATVTPEDATDKTVVWTSSDETVAKVKDGVVTALKAGKVTITAKTGEVSATCEITVNAKVIPATGITLDKTTAEMIEGETLTLTATVTPEDATDKTVTWTSSDETVAKVVNGVVSALKTGKTTITAKSGEVSATCEITVIPATGINGVVCNDGYAAGNVYTVAGNLVCRKGENLSSLPKGLYIVDGKKIVVK
ncbi:MAG: leucine-rich repeat protein [Prevotella sp.]|nr:leucine-rich repeat protein [Prevotella sp.]